MLLRAHYERLLVVASSDAIGEALTSPLRTLVLALALVVLGGCREPIDPNEPQGFLQAKGSDTMVNAIQMVSEEFMKEYPHVFVAITGGGSGVGIAALLNRTCDVATTSREMKPREIDMALQRGIHPYEIVIAYDGIVVIVHRNNPIDRLTEDYIRGSFG